MERKRRCLRCRGLRSGVGVVVVVKAEVRVNVDFVQGGVLGGVEGGGGVHAAVVAGIHREMVWR